MCDTRRLDRQLVLFGDAMRPFGAQCSQAPEHRDRMGPEI